MIKFRFQHTFQISCNINSTFRPERESLFQLNRKTESIQLQGKFQVNDVLSIKSLVMAGAVIGILPKFANKDEVQSGELVHILPKAQFKVNLFVF